MIERVSLKIGRMQSEQEFTISIASIDASDRKVIVLQSMQCAAMLDPVTGMFLFTDFGPHHKHLSAYGKPVDISDELKGEIIARGNQICDNRRSRGLTEWMGR